LKGAAVGNGLTEPSIQYNYYEPYAAQHNLVGQTQLDYMLALLPKCDSYLDACNEITVDNVQEHIEEWENCVQGYNFCNTAETTPVYNTGVNPYDVRIPCGNSGLCYNFTLVDEYLNLPDVMEALGTTGHAWAECDNFVHLVMGLAGDWMLDFNNNFAMILNGGIDVLIYAGEYDFICNWMGNNAWSESLIWNYSQQYSLSINQTYYVDNSIAGYYKTSNGLTFLKVLNAGHMVPMDQPQNALAMFNQFTHSSF